MVPILNPSILALWRWPIRVHASKTTPAVVLHHFSLSSRVVLLSGLKNLYSIKYTHVSTIMQNETTKKGLRHQFDEIFLNTSSFLRLTRGPPLPHLCKPGSLLFDYTPRVKWQNDVTDIGSYARDETYFVKNWPAIERTALCWLAEVFSLLELSLK